MSDAYKQLDLFAEGEPPSDRKPLIVPVGDQLHFGHGGYVGTVEFGWYGEGDDAPQRPITEADVLGPVGYQWLPVGPEPEEFPDPEFEGTPDWLILAYASDPFTEQRAEMVHPLSDDDYVDELPGEHIAEDDLLENQRVREVITLNFDPHRSGIHQPLRRWVYWERRPTQDLTANQLSAFVARGVEALSLIEQVHGQESRSNPKGTAGLSLVQ